MAQKKSLFGSKVRSFRLFYAILFVVSVAALAVAYYLQNTQGLAPCPLCILQRFGFMWLAAFALLGVLRGLLGWLGNGLAALGGAAATAVAGYQNWLHMNPSATCMMDDPHKNFVNDLPTAQWWPEMFKASGSCSTPLEPFFGLQIPLWALIGLAFVTLGFVVRLIRR
jgi:disulfide bond formation protein DsbB